MSKAHVTVNLGLPVEYAPTETVQVLRDRALAEFHVHEDRDLLSLFTEGGTELVNDETLAAAGIHPDERLLLRHRPHVVITFNGAEQPFDFAPTETVKTLLEQALDKFGVDQNRHMMSLFTEGGTELVDHETLAAAGIHSRDLLVLRQSIVKGGAF